MGAQGQADRSGSQTFLKSSKITLESLPDDTILVHATNCLGEWGAGVAKAIAATWPAANDVYAAHCEGASKGQLEGTCLLIPPQPQDGSCNTKKRKQTSRSDRAEDEPRSPPKVWIACLFTSYGYGRPTKKKAGKDSKAKIIGYTSSALKDLRRQVDRLSTPSDNESSNKSYDLECHEDNTDQSERVNRKRKRTKSDEDSGERKAQKGYAHSAKRADKKQPMKVIYSPKFNSGTFGVPWDQTNAKIIEVFEDWEGEWLILAPHRLT